MQEEGDDMCHLTHSAANRNEIEMTNVAYRGLDLAQVQAV